MGMVLVFDPYDCSFFSDSVDRVLHGWLRRRYFMGHASCFELVFAIYPVPYIRFPYMHRGHLSGDALERLEWEQHVDMIEMAGGNEGDRINGVLGSRLKLDNLFWQLRFAHINAYIMGMKTYLAKVSSLRHFRLLSSPLICPRQL